LTPRPTIAQEAGIEIDHDLPRLAAVRKEADALDRREPVTMR